MTAAGAGQLGGYQRCAFTAAGTGTFEAGPATTPAVGRPGQRTTVPELRLEMVAPPGQREAVGAALRVAHPYEEPSYDVSTVLVPRGRGMGRVGQLATGEPLGAFADRVARVLPSTRHGVRVAGDPDRLVRRVAVCGGAGDSLLGAARAAGADVLVTADLRHHPAQEAVADGLALVDIAHWASEWPWLPVAARLLTADLGAAGHTVTTTVSARVTDPWTR